MVEPRTLTDGFVAAVWAATLSGIPSTIHGIIKGNPWEPTLAAGSILLPRETRPFVLAVAALPVHAAISLWWGIVLSVVLPRRNTVATGILAGGAIAALDLGIIGRRFPRIRALPWAPQIADHLAYGLVAAIILNHRRGMTEN